MNEQSTAASQVHAGVEDMQYCPQSGDCLQEVLITSPGMADKQFIANRWLSTDEGDKQTYVVLYPSNDGKQPEPHKYRIIVGPGRKLLKYTG
jgi:hypothetical protein